MAREVGQGIGGLPELLQQRAHFVDDIGIGGVGLERAPHQLFAPRTFTNEIE